MPKKTPDELNIAIVTGLMKGQTMKEMSNKFGCNQNALTSRLQAFRRRRKARDTFHLIGILLSEDLIN